MPSSMATSSFWLMLRKYRAFAFCVQQGSLYPHACLDSSRRRDLTSTQGATPLTLILSFSPQGRRDLTACAGTTGVVQEWSRAENF